MNLDYQIAKDYLLKLPVEQREDLCKSTLSGLKTRKKTRREVEIEYKSFLTKSKSFQDFKNKYGLKK
ncbi:hypothetical protein [Chryseobacterium indologenes]|uniref:hypothetical protein n=1 Tax=Chryseobacterium indologenes TaxID=253 RepID=UPI003D356335